VRAAATGEALTEDEARLLPAAKRQLEGASEGIDLTALDPDDVKTTLAGLQTTAGLLSRAAGLYETVDEHRSMTTALLRNRPRNPHTSAALQTLLRALDEIALKALQANTTAELDAVENQDDEAARHLRTLERDDYERQDEELIRVELAPRQVELSCRVVTADDADTTVHIRDSVAFTAQVSPPDAMDRIEFRYSDGASATLSIPADGRVIDYRTFDRPGSIRASVHAVPGGERLSETTLAVAETPRAATQRVALTQRDRAMALIAGVLAVGSGLLALYVTDPAWGETSDYLAAVLWGAVTAEGVKLAAAIADRVWPAGG
jgi:hypothetical protein